GSRMRHSNHKRHRLRLSVKTNCRIFKEHMRPLHLEEGDPHAMSDTGIGRMTHDTPFELISSKSRPVWWSQSGSNRRPSRCKRDALPAELWPLVHWLKSSRRFQRTSLRRPRAKSVVFARCV